LSTPIELNRVDKFLSCTVDYCWLWIVRIFNIICLHFQERGGTNLLLCVALLGLWQAGPVAVAMVRKRHSPIVTMILSSNGLGDVTNSRCYCDLSGPLVSDLKEQWARRVVICPSLL
jgi:hypothetical protein